MVDTTQGRVRAVARWPRRAWHWVRDHRYQLSDWAWAAGLFPLVLAFTLAGPGNRLSRLVGVLPTRDAVTEFVISSAVVVPAVALVMVAILLRRTRPSLLLTVAAAMLFVLGNFIPATIAVYSYAAWFANRRRLAAWSVVMALGMLSAMVHGPTVVPATIVNYVIFIALPLTAGLWVGTRRQLIANLHERAERLEREQHLKAERALATERTRIAREMHDVVAHRVSLMVVHAGGLEVTSSEDTTVQTAGLIRHTGREALSELREILGVLRDEANGGMGTAGDGGPADAGANADGNTDAAAPTAPQPVLRDLDRLVGDWRAAGMAVDWRTVGSPRRLPAQTERTAYRVVQEALTNAGKHAPGGAVAVRVDYGDGDLEVGVANAPSPHGSGTRPEPPPSSGFGLAGLRERVALAGGRLEAGADPDGGWRVRAIVPVAHAPESRGGPDNDRAGGGQG